MSSRPKRAGAGTRDAHAFAQQSAAAEAAAKTTRAAKATRRASREPEEEANAGPPKKRAKATAAPAAAKSKTAAAKAKAKAKAAPPAAKKKAVKKPAKKAAGAAAAAVPARVALLFEPAEGGRVAKTKAKAAYMLSEKDMEALAFEEYTNPIDSEWAPMKLYLRDDVSAKALEKYGSVEAIAETLAAREAKRDAKKKR